MSDKQGSGVTGTIAGLGLALGGLAVGALIQSRTQRGPAGTTGDAPDYTGRGSAMGQYDVIGRTVTIRKSPQEVYDFWRDFQNLAGVMENVDAIRPSDEGNGRNIWTIRAPAGRTVDVETEVSEDKPGELIAWRSVSGSAVDTEGRVTFIKAPGDRGTRVTLVINYKPPAGELGRMIAKAFLREPEVQARHDLKRLKMLLETGEVATSARRKENTRAAQQENAA